MKHGKAAMLALGALLALGACKDDEKKDKASAESQKEMKTATGEPAGGKGRDPQTDYEVATEEDFEEAMEQQITAETDLSKELDRLEQEITK